MSVIMCIKRGIIKLFRCTTIFEKTRNTGYTQKNSAVSIVFTIEAAPLFCVYPGHASPSKLKPTIHSHTRQMVILVFKYRNIERKTRTFQCFTLQISVKVKLSVLN
jgi:hypothetical protein